jgi:hypothetical protein
LGVAAWGPAREKRSVVVPSGLVVGGRAVRGSHGLVPSLDSAEMERARRAWELTRVSVER